jgi:methylmalonyl-CoA mutase C-terminal domain/subunit
MAKEKKAEKPMRALICKTGLETHDIGVKVVASALRDAGMEVIYMGTRQTPERVVEAAIEEDVDVLGISFHSPVYEETCGKVLQLLKERNANPLFVIGGCILVEDIPELKAMGVAEVFPAETPLDNIVNFIKDNVKGKGG